MVNCQHCPPFTARLLGLFFSELGPISIANYLTTMPSSTDGNHSHISPVSSNFSIAIIGGGIGGLSAALALAAYNPTLRANNVAVYEQAPTYSEIGAGVAIGIQAAQVLQKFGVWEAADSISGYRSNVHRSNRRWDNDDLVVDAPAANSDGDIRQLWVHRAEFLEVLHNEIKRKGYAKLETNKKVVKIEVRPPFCSSASPMAEGPFISIFTV